LTTNGEHDKVVPLVVPHGKIVDFIDGALRNDTPEEYVRQEMEKSIVREYMYPVDQLQVEFAIKSGSNKRRLDIVIFPEGTQHTPADVWAIVECKSSDVPSTHKKEGIEQLQSYMADLVNAEFGMWTNGVERFCYRKVQKGNKWVFEEITDIPAKGKTVEDAERPTLDNLDAASSDDLLFAFRGCHDYIAGNQGLQKPEAFWELLKIIFCKIEDERDGEDLQFYATSTERQSLNGQLKVQARIKKLFERVATKYPSIFKKGDNIDLEPRVLAYCVSRLQKYALLDSGIDVKGKAYEEIVGSNLRGDRGEFFTPRNICKMAVLMMDPREDQVVLDPACGTGGFLVISLNHVIEKIRAAERKKWKNPLAPKETEYAKLIDRIWAYANERIVGIDLNPNLVKATKMNMVMNNDGSGGLYQANSLARPVTWSEDLRNRDLFGDVDLIFTNPPFGSKIPIDDPTILEQYELAHVWDYDKDDDTWEIREPRQLQKSQPPEILFIERCVQFLKPGSGMMSIVLPDGILGAPGLGYVREWILRNTQVVASIDLHPDTFAPKNSTQTSLLVLRRKSAKEIEIERAAGKKATYDVFMALANHIGHDKRGNPIYKRDENGNKTVVKRKESRKQVVQGVVKTVEVEVTLDVEDDDTQQIAASFRQWFGAKR
jgi:type I restriction enzyme M protein